MEYERVMETVASIRTSWNEKPVAGIVLGTGLGGLADAIHTEAIFPYEELPNFVRSTVESHAGRLICGLLDGKRVVAMQGRFHYYEGYAARDIVFPIRVMRALGAETLVVSNACGGLNPQFSAGDVMLIEDHINLLGINPLIGLNDDRIGPRFPDMSEPYSRDLLAKARQAAIDAGFHVQQGVYVSVAGPNLETRAEYRFLRAIGADAVGMSTVPEVIAAVHAGMKVLGVSVVTDMGLPDALDPAEIGRILENAAKAEPKMIAVIRGVLANL